MFTGIVEEVGTVQAIDLERAQGGLVVAARAVLTGTHIGDSMAVNGACLTVTEVSSNQFAVGVMPETLRRTNLAGLEVGDGVNLERALRPDARLGGHFVQGHVDGTGRVVSVQPDGPALAVRIETSAEVLRYVVEKGFVAVDGVSLTVTGVDEQGFGVALVSYTQEHIAPGLLQTGHVANLEVDILAKYVEKLVVH